MKLTPNLPTSFVVAALAAATTPLGVVVAVGPFHPSMYAGHEEIRSAFYTDQCITVVGQKVMLKDCAGGNHQIFRYDQNTHQVGSNSYECLTWPNGNGQGDNELSWIQAIVGNVPTDSTWKQDADDRIHNYVDGGVKCLTAPADLSQPLSMEDCIEPADKHQQWMGKSDFTPAPTPPPTTPAPTPTPPVTGKGTGDPHFSLFGGKKFDFHGGCDLILLQSPAFASGLGLHIHIRTKIHTWWSYIEAAVIQIGENTLEIRGGKDGDSMPHYWVNGLPGGIGSSQEKDEDAVFRDSQLQAMIQDLKEEIGSFNITYKRVNSKQHKFRLALDHSGDAISLETYKDWVSVNVAIKSDQESNFQGSLGLMGAFPSGSMVARDGRTIINDPDAFGKEWQVLSEEPMLFHKVEGPQSPDTCAMPSDAISSSTRKKRRLGESAVSIKAASNACEHVPEVDRNNCISDVLASNDVGVAGVY